VQYAKGAWEEWFAKDGMKISLEKATKMILTMYTKLYS
jgi:hypothetical protein